MQAHTILAATLLVECALYALHLARAAMFQTTTLRRVR